MENRVIKRLSSLSGLLLAAALGGAGPAQAHDIGAYGMVDHVDADVVAQLAEMIRLNGGYALDQVEVRKTEGSSNTYAIESPWFDAPLMVRLGSCLEGICSRISLVQIFRFSGFEDEPEYADDVVMDINEDVQPSGLSRSGSDRFFVRRQIEVGANTSSDEFFAQWRQFQTAVENAMVELAAGKAELDSFNS